MTKPERTRGEEGPGVEVVKLDQAELEMLGKVEESFLEKGKSARVPELAIFMGHIGAGKTTLRLQQCGSSHVQVDFRDVLAALTRALGTRQRHPRMLAYATIVSETVLSLAVAQRKNIAIEVTGGAADLLPPIIEKMKELGYEVSGRFVEVDPAEGYRRHVKAVQEDPDYMSAFHTEGATLGFIYRHLGLSTEPLDAYEAAKEEREARARS